MSVPCSACAAESLFAEVSTPGFEVQRCRACGHRMARHLAVAPSTDYHEQYDQGAFLESLRITRVRQARRILGWIAAAAPGATRLLDFGCGRGWLLDEARAAGWQVMGADTSAKATELLRGRGIPAVQVAPGDRELPPAVRALLPEVLTLLDVIEHFPADCLLQRQGELVASAGPAVRLVVIKVPNSGGLLYKTASALRRAGAPRALQQLYQVGSAPPHHHYFTARSLQRLLARADLAVVALERDRDFEPSTLAARAGLDLPRPLVQLAGTLAAAACRAMRMEDSLICLVRPTPQISATAAGPAVARPARHSAP